MEYILRKAIAEGKIDLKTTDSHKINETQKIQFLEQGLLDLIKNRDKQACAIILEYYIQVYGTVSNETGEKIKQMLEAKE